MLVNVKQTPPNRPSLRFDSENRIRGCKQLVGYLPMKPISIIFASGLCAATAGTASANEVAVRYADLNLSTERGQAELAHRVDAAAREACNRTPRPGSLL